jgi:phenylalanyl-tRNA synthetase beta chain
LRVPLSWLRDFAPFVGEPAELAAILDDLGLVVEGIETVGEGLGDVVVARVAEVSPIEGADRIRSVVVDNGTGPVEIVCGAWNFEVGDLVALAPVGAVLPGGFSIKARMMKGAPSNGMLCSGRELNLSDDHEGILRLNDVEGAAVGASLMEALGIEPDVIFDIAVEANRPDAWCIAGVARDLAARTGVPFSMPDLDAGAGGEMSRGAVGAPAETVTSVRVDDLELCPRFTARVITGITVGPSPRWLARRLTMAGMRPINNVVDASNYVMLELGQPTHPYDLDRLAGGGLIVRRAEPGETLTTLDGTVRTLGRPGPGLGDTGQDCLICDAQGSPVGIAGVMGGASSEIDASSTRVLLEAAYFVPMAIARTSKRLGLRTEASARFERGCDPAGIDRAAARFCELLALTAGPAMTVAGGVIDIRGEVPGPLTMTVRASRINALLGTDFSSSQIAGLLTPLGMTVDPAVDHGRPGGAEDGVLEVTVPTFRPDIRPAPMGEADIAEEVARTYGYARIARRAPSWSQPGRLTQYQKDRRHLKVVLCGLGASEAWTETFVSESDQRSSGVDPPYVEVTNPLVESERFLRASMMPGLIRAVEYNTERRQGGVRLFEVGSVFHHPGRPPADDEADDGEVGPSDPSERLSAIFALGDDDAWTMVAAWRTIAEALGIAEWELGDLAGPGAVAKVLHRYRSAAIFSRSAGTDDDESAGSRSAVGVVGELDPSVVARFGLLGTDGRPRRIGWLDLDIGLLLDRGRTARRSEEARPISRYPSSDVDLSFVVPDGVPAGSVQRTLRAAGGDLLESIELFAVYRGTSVEEGSRSLTFRLRFCAPDHTLTDEELGRLRTACIVAVEARYSATLR